VDTRGNLGVPQEFVGMVGLSTGGHIYTSNVPQPESKHFLLCSLIIFRLSEIFTFFVVVVVACTKCQIK